MRRLARYPSLVAGLVTFLAVLLLAPAPRAQDLTTILSQFLGDLRAGTLGVSYPITSITTTGAVSPGSVVVSAGGLISWLGRELFGSTANGLITMSQNSGSNRIQINTGTAAPTVTSCGTGAVTAFSTNTAGEITPTGATACTVTFGLPNWTNKPFCVVTMETVAEAVRISAISTTAFTATFTTAANVFSYVCFGGT